MDMPMLPESGNLFVLSWDNLGLEHIVDVGPIVNESIISVLKGNGSRMNELRSTVNGMMLRARYNSQRHYEIYSITTTDDITKDDLVRQFETNPQGMAELIRARGTQLYSDRIQTEKCKII